MWDFLKKRLRPTTNTTPSPLSRPAIPTTSASSATPGRPTIPWIAAADNPWQVAVLDVRPITHTMLSSSRDPQCATNAVSFGRDDGLGFLTHQPPNQRAIPTTLRYRRDRLLADGPLFIPRVMEHKWAIFHHAGRILCVRSWQRLVQVTASLQQDGGEIRITDITGTFVDDTEDPTVTIRLFDYLVRTHVLGLPYPVPIPMDLEKQPYEAALWCMALFGNLAAVATAHPIPASIPEKPLRSHSLLHIAVARGDVAAVESCLASGIPVDLLAADGLPPMQWAMSTTMMEVLLRHGSSVDVRSLEGATPLMTVVQSDRMEQVDWLLAHGAQVDAVDSRGFTALHRVAEMGKRVLVEKLLAHGADPAIAAQGHDARSFAQQRGHQEIIALLGG